MNQIVVVTGASSGLGLSLVNRFIQRGDSVYGVTKTKRHWKSAYDAISNKALFHLRQVDLKSEPQTRRFFHDLSRRTRRIDVLIHCAGYGGTLSRIEDLDKWEFQKHISNNLLSAFLVSKYAIPIFRKQRKGLIIFISSMAGKRAVPKLSAYSASKFGVLGIAQCVAKENRDVGLKAFTVCPGGMNTRMRARIFGREDAQKQQGPEFVTEVTMKVIQGKIHVESGGDIIIRHGKISAINPCPPA